MSEVRAAARLHAARAWLCFGAAAAFVASAALAEEPLPSDIPGFATNPRLPPVDEAAVRINDLLATQDTRALAARADCLAAGEGSVWSRTVEVPYLGPRYLSVVSYLDFYCAGAAHPTGYTIALTLDRQTGYPVDWGKLLGLPPAPADKPGPPDPARPFPLRDAYLAALGPVSAKCLTVLENWARFALWLDADRGAVAIEPVSLAHVDRTCIDTAYLDRTTLVDRKAATDLIEALVHVSP